MADKLSTFMCRLLLNLGASKSWNFQGLSRAVMGFQSFDWLAAFDMELLQTTLFIAV
jgi:hypothetical protein